MQATQTDLKEALAQHIKKLRGRDITKFRSKNFQIYDSSFDETIQPIFIRFENLNESLNQSLQKIGVDAEIDLPFTKKGLQSSNDLFQQIASKEQIKLINDYHRDDFTRFGYEMIH